jgi:hypothetical protein
LALQGIPFDALSQDRHYKERKRLKKDSDVSSVTTSLENRVGFIAASIFNPTESMLHNSAGDVALVRIPSVGRMFDISNIRGWL